MVELFILNIIISRARRFDNNLFLNTASTVEDANVYTYQKSATAVLSCELRFCYCSLKLNSGSLNTRYDTGTEIEENLTLISITVILVQCTVTS